MFHFAGSSSYALCIQAQISSLQLDGFPHSDIPGSKVACHLTEAFRRLLRPSSSFDVEASTICSYFPLNHKNQNTCGCEIEFVLDLSIVKLLSDTNLRIDTNTIRSHS